jgi:hypothetical protein
MFIRHHALLSSGRAGFVFAHRRATLVVDSTIKAGRESTQSGPTKTRLKLLQMLV